MSVHIDDGTDVVDVRPCFLALGLVIFGEFMHVEYEFVLVLAPLLHVEVVLDFSQDRIIGYEITQRH